MFFASRAPVVLTRRTLTSALRLGLIVGGRHAHWYGTVGDTTLHSRAKQHFLALLGCFFFSRSYMYILRIYIIFRY